MNNEEVREILQEQIDKYGQEYDDKGIEALKTAIKLLEQTRWTPVSERLPNKYEDVSITVKIEDGGEIRYYTSMGYINSLGEWHSEEWNFPPAKVIAWMPLPLKPYRESEDKK